MALTASLGAIASDEDCFSKVASVSKYAPLQTKIEMVNAASPPVKVLTNQSKPNKAEKKLIAEWMAELEQCISITPAYNMDKEAPVLGNLFKSQILSFFTQTANLQAGKFTFGEYANVRATTTTAFLTQLAKLSAEEEERNRAIEKARDERAAQAERDGQQAKRLAYERRMAEQQMAEQAAESRRQAALQYLANQPRPQPYQVQPYVMPTNRTTTTQCQQLGQFTNCTSR